MLKTNHEANSPPGCFGKLYDRTSPECVGGHDPGHFNQNANSPHFQTQTRDTCDFISQCAARQQAQVIPVANLTRPQPTPPASPWATKFNQPTAATPQTWRPPTPPYAHQQHAPQHFMASNFGIPQYLTVREPQTAGTSFSARLAREALRSILKSIGHTFAHFFDVEIVGPPPGGGDGHGG